MKVISLINMKGGVAKTTLAINIADCLYKRHGKSVLVIDVDPQFNATQCLMSGKEYVKYLKDGNDTVVNVFDRSFRPTVGIVEGQKVNKPKSLGDIKTYKTLRGFELLPGALDLYKLEMAPGQGREYRIKNYLREKNYDYVIIDTPPTPSVWMTSALLASDFYLIPVKPDPISLTGIDLLHGIISEKTENFGLTIKCCGLVFTIAEAHTKIFKNAKNSITNSKRWKGKLYKNHLLKRVEVARTQLKQEFILDIGDSELKRSLTSIVQELIERTDDNE
ncbi:ParA family protein [Calidifontibacillus oryziterrae]|uniref:ParA family protein n=1 Tax=Calidifontibacillus oryziterrae TaxID=1191699 RepID=UPI0003119AB1|nr:AAA family ATPase [Calidifontibacillus oryziterrae]